MMLQSCLVFNIQLLKNIILNFELHTILNFSLKIILETFALCSNKKKQLYSFNIKFIILFQYWPNLKIVIFYILYYINSIIIFKNTK